MSLLGKAAVAMWWSVRPEQRAEFGDWHSHEHFPERMSIPGFRRGSRWTEHDGHRRLLRAVRAGAVRGAHVEGISRPAQRADAVVDQDDAAPSRHGPQPVPRRRQLWRRRRDLARHHPAFAGPGARRSCRHICRRRSAIGADAGTDRRAPAADRHARTRSPTTEQQIRGEDGAADWIMLLSGYDADAIEQVTADRLSPAALGTLGAQDNPTIGRYRLAFTITPQDVATI